MARYTALIAALLLLPVGMDQVAAADIPPPNIILIVVDDLGYGDLGCYGATDLRTPHLDRMAAEGMRFTDFSVTAPLCTPSRVSLMTGCYPGRFRLATGVLRPNALNGVPPEAVTLAEVVKSQGYATGCIGKWHLGFVPGMRPMDQGFDSYFGVLHNLDKQETVHFESEGGMPVLRGDEVVERPAVPARMTSLYTREAIAFLEAHREERFFLYVGHQMPHLPFDASDEFKGKSARGLYGDVVEELDWGVGQILSKLSELELDESTLVLFTSDNGPERRTAGTAAPLQGTKHTVYEGGMRVPLIARWPGRVPAGKVCEAFVANLDIFPTIAELTQATETTKSARDGHSFARVLLGEEATSLRESLYVLYGLNERRLESFRQGNWKLHLSDPPKLYRLDQDPAEGMNVASENPQVVKDLTAAAEDLRRSFNGN